jgi:hypothetical protein
MHGRSYRHIKGFFNVIGFIKILQIEPSQWVAIYNICQGREKYKQPFTVQHNVDNFNLSEDIVFRRLQYRQKNLSK